MAGLRHGVYYLPSDELYPGSRGTIFALMMLDLCFADEEDAISAGYRRGPR